MTGYGRILLYRVNTKDENGIYNPKQYGANRVLLEMQEGSFKEGLLDGFGRRITTNLTELPNYRCEARLGFFKQGLRHGKAQYFKNDLLTQGIWNEYNLK